MGISLCWACYSRLLQFATTPIRRLDRLPFTFLPRLSTCLSSLPTTSSALPGIAVHVQQTAWSSLLPFWSAWIASAVSCHLPPRPLLFSHFVTADDVLHLIFDRLDYPGDLAIVNKRFYAFSQDPYVRAHYFMYRYGAVQALYHAFGRGKVLNERVLEVRLVCCLRQASLSFRQILISSGARFSRYLVQVAFHHYFHTRSHFIKTSWVRSVPLPVFNHFLKLATDAYGDIPRGKVSYLKCTRYLDQQRQTEDDGTVFTWFLQQTPHVDSKRVNWETARDLLDKYKVRRVSISPIMRSSTTTVYPILRPGSSHVSVSSRSGAGTAALTLRCIKWFRHGRKVSQFYFPQNV